MGFGQNRDVALPLRGYAGHANTQTLKCDAKIGIIYYLPYSDTLRSSMKLILRNQVASLCFCNAVAAVSFQISNTNAHKDTTC